MHFHSRRLGADRSNLHNPNLSPIGLALCPHSDKELSNVLTELTIALRGAIVFRNLAAPAATIASLKKWDRTEACRTPFPTKGGTCDNLSGHV